MPQFLVPWKVSAHRLAAIALYRALLSQCRRCGLDPEQQQQISNVVRNRFKENRYNHSKKQIPILFKAGYSAIDHLDEAVAGVEASKTYLIDLLNSAPAKAKRPAYRPPPRVKAASIPHDSAPKRSVLDRPLPLSELTGKRKIPRMVNAGGLPMLRIKKPQPPALSAYIRKRIKRKEKRLLCLGRLETEFELAMQEDEWDDMLEENTHDGSQVFARAVQEPPWSLAVIDCHAALRDAINRETQKNMEMAHKMQHVVDEERKLAKQESAERLRQRDASMPQA